MQILLNLNPALNKLEVEAHPENGSFLLLQLLLRMLENQFNCSSTWEEHIDFFQSPGGFNRRRKSTRYIYDFKEPVSLIHTFEKKNLFSLRYYLSS